MPVPEHFSSVNERPSLLPPVDNSKGEVIKNRAATEPELFTNAVVKTRSKLVIPYVAPEHWRSVAGSIHEELLLEFAIFQRSYTEEFRCPPLNKPQLPKHLNANM